MANTAVVYRLSDLNKGYRVAGLFGGVLALGKASTDEIWAQMTDVPVPGNKTGKPEPQGTKPIITTFGKWKKLYPDTKILAPEEKFSFYYEAYDKKPKGYDANPMLMATLGKVDSRIKLGDEVLGVSINGKSKAYPLNWIKQKGQFKDKIGKQSVTILWDKDLDTPRVQEPFNGTWMRSYWYAWSTFYPNTGLAQ